MFQHQPASVFAPYRIVDEIEELIKSFHIDGAKLLMHSFSIDDVAHFTTLCSSCNQNKETNNTIKATSVVSVGEAPMPKSISLERRN
jgi:hypothetical protein